MSSHTVTRHTTSAPPRGSGLHAGTLIAAAISAVVAATVVSKLWQPGTIMATAMTPVIVTLVKEAIERPARRVTSIAGRATAVPIAPPEPEGRFEPIGSPPAVVVTDDDGLTPMRVYRPQRKVRRRWKLALATGLLAFLIAVAAMTLPELVAGRSVVSSSHDTTIFGGHRSTAATTKDKPVDKTKTEEQTVSTEKTPTDQTDTQPETTTTAPEQTTESVPQTQTQTAPQTQTQTQPPPTTTQPPAAQQQPTPTTP
jgi:hypothetical protein